MGSARARSTSLPLARSIEGLRALRILAAAPRPVVFLDVDGTLAPIVDRPAAARVPAATRRVIHRLRATGVRVVLVSGRSIAGAQAVARLRVDAIMGNHGADILRDGRLGPWTRAGRRVARAAARRLAALLAGWPRVELETKEHSLAVHFRRHPAAGPALARAVRAALRGTGLQVRVGNKVLDVRARGADKGAAVLRWLRVVERGRVPLEHVVYAGDDTTDEDAFRALGRRAVTIAVGPRVGHARFRTASTVTFAAWLERLAGLRDMGKAAAERPRSRPSRRPPRRPRSTARDRSR